jgi:hypothetical protein
MSDFLWHYTDHRGMIGIWEAEEFWATDIRYLNDGAEYSHALRVIEAAIAKRLDGDEYAGYRRALSEVFREIERGGPIRLPFPFSWMASAVPFVTSFSAHEDDLSQWRGYCQVGSGLALGISRERLREAASECGAELRRCVYVKAGTGEVYKSDLQKSETDSAAEYEADLQVFADAISQSRREASTAEASSALHDVSVIRNLLTSHPVIVRDRSRVKDYAFRLEEEYRVVFNYFPGGLLLRPGYPPVPYELAFRPGRTSPRPYVGLPILRDQREIVERIIVGPTPAMGLAIEAVRARWPHADVSPSAVPYRDV